MSLTEKRLRKLEARVDGLEETLEIMGDKNLVRSIARGFEDLKKGNYFRYDSAKSLFSELG